MTFLQPLKTLLTMTRRGRPPRVSVEDGVATTSVYGQEYQFRIGKNGTLYPIGQARSATPEDKQFAKEVIFRHIREE